MESYSWYQMIQQPTWAPPGWLFGPVWTVLYILIAISFGHVVTEVVRKKLPVRCVIPFLLNLVFNGVFTPIQNAFYPGSAHDWLGTLAIVLVLATLVWGMVAIWNHRRWVAYMNFPYLAWVLFATVLQITITIMN